MHIGSSSKMPSTSADAPPAVGSTLTHSNATYSMVDFMFSGVLVRFPELKLAYAEGQIGWIPYILERADKVWEENRGWGGVADIVPEPPVHLLPPPDLRLLLRRRLRAEERRVDRRRQHHLRVRLPALRLDVAPHPPDRREADEGPHRRAGVQDRARQRHQAVRPRLQVSLRGPSSAGDRRHLAHGPSLHRRRTGVPGRASPLAGRRRSRACRPSPRPRTGPGAAPTTPAGSACSSTPATPARLAGERRRPGLARRSSSSSSKRSSNGPTPPTSG